LKSVLVDEEKALNSYRHAVSKLLPKATRIAWHLKKDEIKDDLPAITKRQVLYNLKRSNFEKEWARITRDQSGRAVFGIPLLLLPKWGPLKVLQFRTPTPKPSDFLRPVSTKRSIAIESFGAERDGKVSLPNDNFDVGADTGRAIQIERRRARRIGRSSGGPEVCNVTPSLRSELEHFFRIRVCHM